MINNNITLNLPPITNSCEAGSDTSCVASTIGGIASLATPSPTATASCSANSSPLTAVSQLAASSSAPTEGGTLPAAHSLSTELGTQMESALQGENIINLLFNLADVLSIILPVLLSIAFMTIIERKQLAAHQRRVGPNTVGYYGILQPFADALKLILKETIIPSQSNKIVFYLAPVSTLVFSLLGWAVIPFGEGIVLSDLSLGILYTLALSSLGVYGVLLAGWSANSKYAFLGSLRSTAAMISYELILSSAILIIILLTGTLNYTSIIEIQQSVWFIIPLLPVFIFYFISILAETSRTPFDLQEAESELVAGFFTEHSSVPFVFFFLGEYSSIVLFSSITAILFLGGYNLPEIFINETIINLQAIILGIKTCIFTFFFVWFRATLPRLRYDQLIQLCWLNLLPVAVAFIILIPSILISFDISPY
jgi:NADH-ubiquinone oxidoreductase chain 1